MINYLNSDNELCDLVDSPEYIFFYFHIWYVARFGQIIFWMIATLAISQNH
jgi:hypothetical protein